MEELYATATDEEILAQFDDTDDFGMLEHYVKPVKIIEEETGSASLYWAIMGSIVNKKKFSDADIDKHFVTYMAMNMLKTDPQAVYEANIFNSARGQKFLAKHKIAEYKALRSLIKIPRNKFLKGDKIDKEQNTILEIIGRHYKVGTVTSKDYYRILKGPRLISLLELYARRNENKMSAVEKKKVMEIRTAITKKKKEILS
jgi:hypothetical protein